MRVAADQLLAAVLGDRGEVARAALLEQQRQEVDLEEDVAELVEQLRVVAAVGRVGELVGLLDRVRDDRALVLLAVPGALAPQAAGDLVEARERLGESRRRRRSAGAAARVPGLPAPAAAAGPPACGAPAAVRRRRRPASRVFVFGAFEQSWVMKPSRQFVLSFHFFWKFLTNSLSAFCWFCESAAG